MDPASRRDGDLYRLTPQDVERFRRDGWLRLEGFLVEDELAPLEDVYERMLRREIAVAGRDYCDMSGDYARPVEEYAVVNVMLPRRYHPPLAGNLYERRAASVAAALLGDDMVLDYDQFVAKPPGHPDAVFHWHQDLAYWPITSDTRTASFWLALDDVDRDNGCVRFVPGSHRESALRPHGPLHGDRDRSHTLVAAVDERRERIDDAVLRRGDVTVHHERTLHGSGGNPSGRWRRGYVVAYRSAATVAAERSMGFTHSHDDDLETLKRVGYRGST